MPKQKTHSGSKKRFKVTGTGKVMKQQAGYAPQPRGQVLEAQARLNKDQVVSAPDAKVIKKLLGR